MKWVFVLKTSAPIERGAIHKALEMLQVPFKVSFKDDTTATIFGDEQLLRRLDERAYALHQTLNVHLVIVAAHKANDLAFRSLTRALALCPDRLVFLSDVLYKDISFGDFAFVPYLHQEFQNVDSDALEAAGSYLRSSLNAIEAAKSLYIHRNTFRLRFMKFIAETELDIRDYHNALYLELYFQFAQRKR